MRMSSSKSALRGGLPTAARASTPLPGLPFSPCPSGDLSEDAAAPRLGDRARRAAVRPRRRASRRLPCRPPARQPRPPWGMLLLFDDPPRAGDAPRWEALFEAEFGDDPRVTHRTFAWDRSDGAAGAVHDDFVPRGHALEESFGLVANARRGRPHPRESRDVLVRELDPAGGSDEELWQAVVELQVACRGEGYGEEEHRGFSLARLADRRALFREGRGGWYVALDPSTGAVTGSCGLKPDTTPSACTSHSDSSAVSTWSDAATGSGPARAPSHPDVLRAALEPRVGLVAGVRKTPAAPQRSPGCGRRAVV
jgi:hypothetical protein